MIGAGPNGLVAANLLADAGLEVVVLEAQAEPGGAVRSGQITVAGYLHDRFSAFYPLAVVSPALRALHLEDHGLVWRRAEVALAHVFEDGSAAAVWPQVDQTAESVEHHGRGDGRAWRELALEWQRLGPPLVEALLRPFPPLAPAARLLVRLGGPHDALSFLRRALLPVRRFTEEHFSGPGASMLVAGSTLHTDLGPESALGGLYGWLLAMLAQTVGFPVPEGGAAQLTAALVRRLRSRGGELRCGCRVERVTLRSGRAVAVRLAGGETVPARRAVVADVAASHLYLDLVGPEHLPARLTSEVRRWQLDHGTFKVDWALARPIPWQDDQARRAGAVHLGRDMEHLSSYAGDLAAGRVPEKPFLLLGQMGRADPTRSPPGTETAWAYTHVPNPRARPGAARWDEATRSALAERIEAEVEARAPGFRALVLGRRVADPLRLEAEDANLVGGAVNAGTAQLHQQLVFRPVPGRAGPATPVEALYLASASAHPGGGVHGACGAAAARLVLRRSRRSRP